MKKTISLSLLLTGLMIIPAKAQDHKSTICVNGGVSLVGQIISGLSNSATLGYTTSNYSIPAIQLSYDFSAAKWFSIGIAGAYQTMGIKFKDYPYYDANNNLVTGNFKASGNRLNIGVRALFHYGGLDKVDMYSGLRMGYSSWSFKTNSMDPTFDASSYFKSSGHVWPQFILYGIRVYFTENLGINGEIAIGPPYYASFGLNYRI